MAYLFILPSFETTDFDAEVIENISKGVTTTSTTEKIIMKYMKKIAMKKILIRKIEIVDEDKQELIKFTTAEKDH